MKIDTLVDHGPNMEDSKQARDDYAEYEKIIPKAKHLIVAPGARISIGGITVDIVAAAGKRVDHPLRAVGETNPLCATEPQASEDLSENARSIGLMVTFGQFRLVDLGDLTKHNERELACPVNLLGRADLYLVTHHGLDLRTQGRLSGHCIRALPS